MCSCIRKMGLYAYSCACWHEGYRESLDLERRTSHALASFRAIQATVNLLLIASGRWPEKKGL